MEMNHDRPRRAGLWRRLGLLPMVTALLGIAIVPSGVSANNDPHRFYLAADPFDVPAEWCGYPIHVDIPVNREYAKPSAQPDGTQILHVTGALVWTLTNTVNQKSVTVNVSGPGTITYSPDGQHVSVDLTGRTILLAPNLTDFGLPNGVVLSGPVHFTQTAGDFAFSSLSGDPHVALDVCAALA
jgi:hypothetical protein